MMDAFHTPAQSPVALETFNCVWSRRRRCCFIFEMLFVCQRNESSKTLLLKLHIKHVLTILTIDIFFVRLHRNMTLITIQLQLNKSYFQENEISLGHGQGKTFRSHPRKRKLRRGQKAEVGRSGKGRKPRDRQGRHRVGSAWGIQEGGLACESGDTILRWVSAKEKGGAYTKSELVMTGGVDVTDEVIGRRGEQTLIMTHSPCSLCTEVSSGRCTIYFLKLCVCVICWNCQIIK